MNELEIDVYKRLKELAKSNYYQSLFSLSKEIKTSLFENDRDFSNLQFTFLSLVSTYNVINLDIAMNDVNKIVLEDEIYIEAYMYYKNNKPQKDSNKRKETAPQPSSQWVFKSGNRKV